MEEVKRKDYRKNNDIIMSQSKTSLDHTTKTRLTTDQAVKIDLVNILSSIKYIYFIDISDLDFKEEYFYDKVISLFRNELKCCVLGVTEGARIS